MHLSVVWLLLSALPLLVLLAESCGVVSPYGQCLVARSCPRYGLYRVLLLRGGGEDEEMGEAASGVESGTYVPGTMQNEPSLDSVMTADVSQAGSLNPRSPGPGILCVCIRCECV